MADPFAVAVDVALDRAPSVGNGRDPVVVFPPPGLVEGERVTAPP
jgi:hypothetical protein